MSPFVKTITINREIKEKRTQHGSLSCYILVFIARAWYWRPSPLPTPKKKKHRRSYFGHVQPITEINSESLVLLHPPYSVIEKKKHRRSYFGHVQTITEINIFYGNNYRTRQIKLTSLTLPSCLTHQFIWLNKKVKKIK